jgi:Hemerythrin HHE cation binding domain
MRAIGRKRAGAKNAAPPQSMRPVVECLKAQHREVEASMEAVAQLSASGHREACLRAFAALAARIARQLEAEEELLGSLYGPRAGDIGKTLREDHRQLTALVAACNERLEDDDLLRFADDAQTLMLKFALHAAREERALASDEAGLAEHESAVGLFVERMAPKR